MPDLIDFEGADVKVDDGVEFFECQRCGEYNIIKNTPKNRRNKTVRHLRLDNVVFASFKKFCMINNIDYNYGLLMLIKNAKSPNIDYMVNPNIFVEKKRSSALDNSDKEDDDTADDEDGNHGVHSSLL